MFSLPFPRTWFCRRLGALALLSTGLLAGLPAAHAATPPPALAALEYGGNQDALIALDRAITQAGTDRAAIGQLLSAMDAALRQSGVTAAARQAISERAGALLAALPAAERGARLGAYTAMLKDPQQVNLGRLALDAVPGAAVDEALIDALKSSTGAHRVALLSSVGLRRIAGAVPLLAPLLADTQLATSSGAAHALGQIGTPDALAALLRAPDATRAVVVEARLACAWSLPGAAGVNALQAVMKDAKIAASQRAAAWRGLLEREPSMAANRISEVLLGGEPAFRSVALETMVDFAPSNFVRDLTATFARWDAPTQAAVLQALALRADGAAVPVALGAVAHPDVGVRVAALNTLGRLPGNREVVLRLVKAATELTGDEATAARRSLSLIKGPDVSETVLKGAAQGEPSVRAVYLEAIGQRGMTEAVPALLALRRDSDATVRASALGALADLAPASTQPAVLVWAMEATDSREATRALRALLNVSLRNPDVAKRDAPLLQAIADGSNDVKLRLLPVLSRLPSAATAAAAGRLAQQPEEKLALAATQELLRWPDDSILPLVVATAAQTPHDAVRKVAVQGATRLLDRGRTLPMAEQSATVAVLLSASREPEVRRSLVAFLGRGASPFAQNLVATLVDDPVVGEVARMAAEAIKANQDWPPVVKASTGPLPQVVDGNTKTIWRTPAVGKPWLQIDFKQSRRLQRITLDQTGRAGDFPEGYEVYVTDDLKQPGTPRVTGNGRRDRTVITLPADTKGRYVLIKLTESQPDGNWSVAELWVDG